MNARLIITALLTSVLNLLLHSLVFIAFLKDFFAAHPASSAELSKLMNKDLDHLVPWALALSALALGLFIALLIQRTGARTFLSGLGEGLAFGLLYWAGINFGIYASSNLFSLPSALMDLVCSAGCMAVSAGFAAWLLGRAGSRSPRERRGAGREPLQLAEARAGH